MQSKTRTKRCSSCHLTKSFQEFADNRCEKDGKAKYCKICFRRKYPTPTKPRSQEDMEKERLLKESKKVCSSCNQIKSFSEFHKQRHTHDGRHSYCKMCRLNKAEQRKEKIRDYRSRYRSRTRHIAAWRQLLRRFLKTTGKKKLTKTEEMLGYGAEAFRLRIEETWVPGMNWSNYGEWHVDHIRPLSSFPTNENAKVANALSNLQALWATTRVINGVEQQGNLNKKDKWNEAISGF